MFEGPFPVIGCNGNNEILIPGGWWFGKLQQNRWWIDLEKKVLVFTALSQGSESSKCKLDVAFNEVE